MRAILTRDMRLCRMRYAKRLMLKCFGNAHAFPEVYLAFSEVLERKGLMQIAGENRSS